MSSSDPVLGDETRREPATATDAGMDVTVTLHGTGPQPLLAYLKALGIFRLVAEQQDAAATGWWSGDVLRIRGKLDRTRLEQFFLEDYRPSPVISPWNNGSGFAPKDGDKESGRALAAIESSTSPRLEPLRAAIAVARKVVAESAAQDDRKAQKESLVQRCRAELPDNAIAWLDACIVLTAQGARFPPLLGLGGIDGHFDFSTNFAQRLPEILPQEFPVHGRRGIRGASERSRELLQAALYGQGTAALSPKTVGQFDPGGAGGANVTAGFEAESLVNPWDLVLALEGSFLFAAAAARRLGFGGSRLASVPFTVRSSAVGYASAAATEEGMQSRAEIWLPLWDHPATLPELVYLFGEGRASVGRRPAGNGVEFARAVATLGIDRGISAFARYAFLQRNGRAYMATPLDRIVTRRGPVKGSSLLDQLDGWLGSVRRQASEHAGLGTAVRDLDRAMYDFALRGSELQYGLEGILAAAGRVERTLASIAASKQARGEQTMEFRPLQGLGADWLNGHEQSLELRLAAALASVGMRDRGGAQRGGDDQASGRGRSEMPPLRANLEAVRATDRLNRHSGWAARGPRVVWGTRPLAENIGLVLARRCLDARAAGAKAVPVTATRFARLADVEQFLNGQVDDDRLGDLLWGACGVVEVQADHRGDAAAPPTIPRAYALLKLLFHPGGISRRLAGAATAHYAPVTIPMEPELAPLLRSGRVNDACELAVRRLRASGLPPLAVDVRVHRGMEARLLAALLFPITNSAADALAGLVLVPGTESRE